MSQSGKYWSDQKSTMAESEIYDSYYKTCVDIAVENKIIPPLMPLVTLGITSEGPFGDFLTKGIYDPRLLVTIFHMANASRAHVFSERMIFRHFVTLYENKNGSENMSHITQDKSGNKKFVLELLRLDKHFTTLVLNRTRIVTNEILLIATRWNINVHEWRDIKYLVTDIAESLEYNPVYLRFVPHLADKRHYETIFQHHGL